MSAAEEEFASHLEAHEIEYKREYMFAKHIGRRWRSDFFIEPDILIEIEGGLWIQGRHNRAATMIKDMDKYNHATLLGYRIYRFTPKHVSDGLAIEMITRARAEEV